MQQKTTHLRRRLLGIDHGDVVAQFVDDQLVPVHCEIAANFELVASKVLARCDGIALLS